MWRRINWRMVALLAAALLAGALLAGALLVWLRSGEQWDVEGRELPLIFIGGVPLSGTRLMRGMLDAHPDVRCGQDTHFVSRILQMRQYWMKSQMERARLKQAGVTRTVMDNAIAAFCLEVIVRYGGTAPRLCNSDPLVLKMSRYVLQLFPNAKFLFMVRDARATVHSIITRNVTITGFNLTSYRQCLTKWNHAAALMYEQCQSIKAKNCLVVHYESLMLRPNATMRRVLSFLHLPWHESVLRYERYINQPNDVTLSNVAHLTNQVERSSNQVERLSDQVERSSDQLNRSLDQMKRSYKVERSSDRMDKVEHLSDQVERSSDKLERSPDKLKRSSDKVEHSSDKMVRSSDKVERSSEKVDLVSDKVDNSSDKVERSSDKVERSSDKVERSSDKVGRASNQVERPLNLDVLNDWVGQVPGDVRADMEDLAPMMVELGYDPWAYPPRYEGMAEVIVVTESS
ncbi:hypothetical protein PYW08_016672 [Mythimna loreyi]|uniref:Uncharacterized protein n=1 Tax=Mythimna loreyi TaxID=667449 RepID=A0ACC2QYV6_9NEOP|nr:hypothetical protein PYW08_016672 [Mythimna loreyi]